MDILCINDTYPRDTLDFWGKQRDFRRIFFNYNSMIEKITNLTQELKLKKLYVIPCLEEKIDIYNKNNEIVYNITRYIPVTSDKPHNDIENGQSYLHYHIDYRFDFVKRSKLILWTKFSDTRVNKNFDRYKLIWNVMECVKLENDNVTLKHFISKSKLKHKCIYKGKCPHRGQNLTGIPAINGIITCPNHGLQFNEITKELI